MRLALAVALAAVIGLWWRGRRLTLDLLLQRSENASLKPFSRRLYALWEFLLAGSGEPLVLLDPAGNVKGVNTAAERLLGHKGMQLTGRPLASFLKEDCELLATVKATLAAGTESKLLRVKVRSLAAPEFDGTVRIARYEGTGGVEWWALVRPAA